MTTAASSPSTIRRAPRLPTCLHVSDIQGLAQLATQGVLGVTDLAESVHGNVYKAVAVPFGLLGQAFVDRAPGASGVRSRGITGLVYGSVRGVTRLAGGAVSAALAGAAPLLPRQAPSPAREGMLSALNGVLGDQLLETGNPLAIRMSLRHQGQTLALEKSALAQALPEATGKILVLAHGLCMNDLQWRAKGPDGHLQTHGETLARALGYTPVYLHYNSGLHTSTNGQQFASLLEQLWQAWPQAPRELTLLTHSMGGLVSRSACDHGEHAGQAWRRGLKNLVFLGTPHHGAPLETLGSWVDTVLVSNVVTRPFASIGQIRSAGITDLRQGNVLDADLQGVDRFARAPDRRQTVPLPTGVACYTVAARDILRQKMRGDGLVSLDSALGRHEDPLRTLAFTAENQWLAHGMNHMELLNRPEVAQQLLRWLGSSLQANG